MGTIEAVNNNIIIKIESLFEILKVYDNPKLTNQIEELENTYTMNTLTVLSKYYAAIKNEVIDNKALYNQFHLIVKQNDIISKLTSLFNEAKEGLKNKENYKKARVHISNFENYTIHGTQQKIDYYNCDLCKVSMSIMADTSELVCTTCGISKKLYGTVFDDTQFYYQEGHRSKHGTYDPTKQCRLWLDRIQALEKVDIPKEIINSVIRCINRDKIRIKTHITCKKIRKYLRELHKTKYNENVPLIRKFIANIVPPKLTDKEHALIVIFFDEVIHIFDRVKPAGKTNCPYHPYFIYKILEQIIINKTPHMRIRKNRILECIHLQSRETLIENDKIWKVVCDTITKFKYIPTDGNVNLDI
jgi:hypothetical protein